MGHEAAPVAYEAAFVAWLLLAVLLHSLGARWTWSLTLAGAGIAIALGFALHDMSPIMQGNK